MIRLTHENMATAFQITSIIFIFSYSVAPEKGKVKQPSVNIVPVNAIVKAGQKVTVQTVFNTQPGQAIKTRAVAHNFSWQPVESAAMFGAQQKEIKSETVPSAIASFSNFAETVYR